MPISVIETTPSPTRPDCRLPLPASSAPKLHQVHSVSPSRSFSRANDGRAFMWAAKRANDGHEVAGRGMLRDQRISIVNRKSAAVGELPSR